MAYDVRFAESVEGHLQVLTAGQRTRVFRAIEVQPTHEPLQETRNRKPLRPNPIAPWELRVGQLRVFYDVAEGPTPTVHCAGGWGQGPGGASHRWPGGAIVKTIKLSEASRPLAEYAAELGDEVVVLTDRDRPVAAIVPLRHADRESLALSTHPEFLAIVAHSRADVRAGRTVSLGALKQKLQARQSPNKRLQPTKARQKSGASRPKRARLRG